MAADPYPIYDDLREGCPVAHTERYGGAWLPTRHADVAAIANDQDHFTPRSIVNEGRPGRRCDARADRGRSADHLGSAIPSDRATPLAARVLAARGRPAARGFTRSLCTSLLDEIGGDGDHVVGAARRLRPAHPGRRDRRRCSASPLKTVTTSGGSSTRSSKASTCRSRSGSRASRPVEEYVDHAGRGSSGQPARRPHDLPLERRDERPAPRAAAHRRHHRAAIGRRDRHDLVGGRRVAVAPRPATRGPRRLLGVRRCSQSR